eukprot:s1247_g9.t1
MGSKNPTISPKPIKTLCVFFSDFQRSYARTMRVRCAPWLQGPKKARRCRRVQWEFMLSQHEKSGLAIGTSDQFPTLLHSPKRPTQQETEALSRHRPLGQWAHGDPAALETPLRNMVKLILIFDFPGFLVVLQGRVPNVGGIDLPLSMISSGLLQNKTRVTSETRVVAGAVGAWELKATRFVSAAFDTSAHPSRTEPEEEEQQCTYNAERVIGNGTFGIVYSAHIVETNETVAIKKVLNHGVEFWREMHHPNIVTLKHAFYTSGDLVDELYLNMDPCLKMGEADMTLLTFSNYFQPPKVVLTIGSLVMEYVPETVYCVMKRYGTRSVGEDGVS